MPRPAYRRAHLVKVRAENKAWQETHLEEHRISAKTYRAAHPEQVRKSFRTWQEANPNVGRDNRQLRRARLANVLSTLTSQEWEAILDAAGRACIYCGVQTQLTIDHLTPISRGGPHTAENVAPACRPCNMSKLTQTADEFLREKGA